MIPTHVRAPGRRRGCAPHGRRHRRPAHHGRRARHHLGLRRLRRVRHPAGARAARRRTTGSYTTRSRLVRRRLRRASSRSPRSRSTAAAAASDLTAARPDLSGTPERPTPTATATDTHCPYCALQCAMTLTPVDAAGAGAPVAVAGRTFPTNRGGLCKKGWTSAELLAAPGRITDPADPRRGERLRRGRLGRGARPGRRPAARASARESGADAVGVFGGGGLTNEKAYQLGKFARLALGTSRIDYNGRFCMSSAAAAGNRAFGVDRGLPFPVDRPRRRRARSCCSGRTSPRPCRRSSATSPARARRGGLIVVDPRRSADRAAHGGRRRDAPAARSRHRPRPAARPHPHRASPRASSTPTTSSGARPGSTPCGAASAAGGRSACRSTPASRSRSCARSPRRLADGARHLHPHRPRRRAARRRHRHGDRRDQPRAGARPRRHRPARATARSPARATGRAAASTGRSATSCPATARSPTRRRARHVAAGLGRRPGDHPRARACPPSSCSAMLGAPAACARLLVHGSNVVVSAPDVDGDPRRARRRSTCSWSATSCCRRRPRSPTSCCPVTQWAEEEGTMTSLEGRVLRRRRALDPPGGGAQRAVDPRRARAPPRRAVGAGRPNRPRCSTSWRAHPPAASPTTRDSATRCSTPGSRRYWPYPAGSTGTPRLFLDRFGHADGRARLVAVRRATRPRRRSAAGELTLITGRLLEHYQSGAQTRRVPELLARAAARLRAELHPATAARLGIADGDPVASANARGAVSARADADRRTSASTPCSCRSTSPARSARTCSPRRSSTRSRRCPSSSAPRSRVRARTRRSA